MQIRVGSATKKSKTSPRTMVKFGLGSAGKQIFGREKICYKTFSRKLHEATVAENHNSKCSGPPPEIKYSKGGLIFGPWSFIPQTSANHSERIYIYRLCRYS